MLQKHIERNIKSVTVSSQKADTIREQLDKPNPDWMTVERALDRAIVIAERINHEMVDQEIALDEILAILEVGF